MTVVFWFCILDCIYCFWLLCSHLPYIGGGGGGGGLVGGQIFPFYLDFRYFMILK